ncbi:uncharacterized protein LOC106665636 isoform X2 [Cimex lectularius]|uniref:FLYWCH-type domain-containing protein n=1 Tax=Cimex lectularius TaxID=79782 RepID=A0A8I6RPT3_CIMLE|nr:uncharacterized protein LOC106665636 isoform X2 [Cimex lectularius]
MAKRLDFQAEIVKITPSKEEDVSVMTDSEIEHNQKRKNRKKLTEKRNYGGYDGLKLVTSRYGKDLLLHNGNSYCKSHVLRSGRVRWRCSRRTRKLCRAQFITEPDKTTFVPGTARLQHNHPPIFPVHEKNTTHNKRNVEKISEHNLLVTFILLRLPSLISLVQMPSSMGKPSDPTETSNDR